MNTTRRTFLGQLATAGIGSLASLQSLHAAIEPRNPYDYQTESNYLIRNAHVLSMDPKIGELAEADILIVNNKISAVGKNITNNTAQVIDGTGKIALPGFVETHWHIWTSLMRAMTGKGKGKDYFSMSIKYGKLFSPDNTYHSTRFALAEAIHSGITHVHDWSHNILSIEHAQASLRAIRESGIRARFSMGVASGKPDVDLGILTHLHAQWETYSNNGLIALGLAWPGIEKDRAAGKSEIETARRLKLPISVHVGRRKDGSDNVTKIANAGLLGKDMQLVHGVDTTPEEYQRIAAAGASVSASPFSEMRIGYGLPPIAQMLKSGAALGLSVDTTPLTGNADMFAIMKMFMNLADGMTRNEFEVNAKRIVEIATIEGARSMGIDKQTGSISPGKQADIQLIDTRAINMGAVTDPFHLLAVSAQPSNVDTVMVNGRILKKQGKLVYQDTNELIKEAALSLKNLMQRAG